MKTAVITGASRGIGAAVAESLSEKGYATALICKSNTDLCEEICLKLREKGCVSGCYKADVSSPDEVRAVFDRIKTDFGNVEALVNCAGIAEQAVFTDITDEMWNKMISTNLSGVFYCCREAIKSMLKSHNGAIVNIASMWGETGASCEVHYSAAKAGVIGLTKALAREVGPSGIRVNAVSPGVIKTDMLSSFYEEDLEALKNETPLLRLGTPEDVANAVEFLLSDNASFITGQVLSVNGGFVI